MSDGPGSGLRMTRPGEDARRLRILRHEGVYHQDGDHQDGKYCNYSDKDLNSAHICEYNHRAYPSAGAWVCGILHANFYEKALFVKADLAASSRPSAAAEPFALCFYSHSRGAHILLVALCIR
jgi:hypothetical protein